MKADNYRINVKIDKKTRDKIDDLRKNQSINISSLFRNFIKSL